MHRYRLKVILLSLGAALGFGSAFAHFSREHREHRAHRECACHHHDHGEPPERPAKEL